MFLSKLLLTFAIIFGIIFLVNFLLSKFLKTERRRIFSYDYVSPFHKKIDWTIRVILACTMFYFIFRMSVYESTSFDNMLLIIASLVVIPDITRSIFEWIHKQRKEAIITISNCGLFFLIVFVFLQFEVYKLYG